MTDGPYTTITVAEYKRMEDAILAMRRIHQTAREFLESGNVTAALTLLREDKN